MKVTEIYHFSHPHLLILRSPETPYQCDGCKELGFGPCYQCDHKECNFHLHEVCATASSSTFHPFFRRCDFRFHKKAPGNRDRYCDACGKDVKGFDYQCLHEKAHDLHPCCANLPRVLSGHGVKVNLRDHVPSKCLKCQSKEISKGIKGWSYVSSCGRYCYHVACVKDMVLEKWKKGYFLKYGDVVETNGLELLEIARSQEVTRQRGEGTSGSKASKFLEKAILYLKLIISAVFGEPTTLVAALVEILLSN